MAKGPSLPTENNIVPLPLQEEFVICKTMKAILTNLVKKDVRYERTRESQGTSAEVGILFYWLRTIFFELGIVLSCVLSRLVLVILAIGSKLITGIGFAHPQSTVAIFSEFTGSVAPQRVRQGQLKNYPLETGPLLCISHPPR